MMTGSDGSRLLTWRSVSRPSTSPRRRSSRTSCGRAARRASSAAACEVATSQAWPRPPRKRASARAWISSSSTIRMVDTLGCSSRDREADLDRGPAALLAGDRDGAVVRGHDLLREGEAEPGTRLLAGGEQGEELAQAVLRDALALVLDADAGEGDVIRAADERDDPDGASRRRGVHGVAEQYAHHLLHLVAVDAHGGERGREREVETEPLLCELRPCQVGAALDQVVHALEGALERDRAREAEEIPDPALETVGRGHDVAEARAARVLGRQVEHLGLRGGADRGQRIADVVRHVGRHLADHGEALGGEQAALVLGQGGGHRVDGPGEGAELVAPGDRHAVREVAGRDDPGRPADGLQRAHEPHADGREVGHHARQHEADDGDHEAGGEARDETSAVVEGVHLGAIESLQTLRCVAYGWGWAGSLTRAPRSAT